MTTPEQVGMSTRRLERLSQAMANYIDDGRIAGVTTLLARRGHIIHRDTFGYRVRETKTPMQEDTIVRLFSMTKPIICTAMMLLYEQGKVRLLDPVAKYIPAFATLQVYAGESASGLELEPLHRFVTIRDLLNHSSGLTYHFLENGPVEAMYRDAEVAVNVPLPEFVDKLLTLPLAFQPGTSWRYSFSHDVIAYLIEIISGQSIAEFLQQSLFAPLGMTDTGYYVTDSNRDRFAAMYGSDDLLDPKITMTKWFDGAMAGTNRLLATPTGSLESAPHTIYRGGHGLVSTIDDYYRFCQMLINNGEFGGLHLLSRKTIELMRSNHLVPELLPFELGGFPNPGVGYGLGFSTTMDVAQTQLPGSIGKYGWGGATNTTFWIDPAEELIAILMAQSMPNGFHPMNMDFQQLIYSAIID